MSRDDNAQRWTSQSRGRCSITSFCLILPCSSGESETNRLNCAAVPLLLNATRHLLEVPSLSCEVIVYIVLVTLRLMTQQCCTGRPMVVI